ncbi:YciI family protein [Corynebacterium hindlerae]|uniref:YciI family protein n=1 Tax=Corynebacterium hindlerae TaxID=699041 RepID=UPI001AD78320|nr:YciI family protein [Corynebacterium hindlerae]QTH58625.1 YciI family protein [Corynebacterium hindlerae]
MNYFAVHYRYPAESEDIARVRPVHREFLATLKEQGALVGSGPFLDNTGGALIIIRLPEPATCADAEQLMDKDPFTLEGVLDGREIREWNPVLNVFS